MKNAAANAAAFFCIYESRAPRPMPRRFFVSTKAGRRGQCRGVFVSTKAGRRGQCRGVFLDYPLRGNGGPHSLRHGL